MKKIILVDGSSYLFRAFHALPHLTNSKGDHSGAILGVLNMLKKLVNQYKSEYIAVIFDAKGKNFRHDLYPDYKANRKKIATELSSQISPLHEIIRNMGYPLFCIDDVEADDVIGTMALKFSNEGHDVVISTGDKDMAQLVNERVSLIDTMKNEATDINRVKSKYGVYPNQVIDYLALVGDTSDNIPGVPKVGPKTASNWLNEYSSLDNIINNAEKFSGKVGDNLRDSLSFLPLSYKLATIKCDVVIEDLSLEKVKCTIQNDAYLYDIFTYYEFKNLLNTVSNEKPENKTKTIYKTILKKEDFDTFYNELYENNETVFDIETNSLDTLSARIIGFSFSFYANHGVYIPLQHEYENAPKQCDYDYVIKKLSLYFANNKAKIAHNAKFDIKVLETNGIKINNFLYDTMLESYIYNSSASRHNMDALAKKYLNYTTTTFEDVAGKGQKQKTFNQIDIKIASDYAAEDADITYQLHNYFWPHINNNQELKDLYFKEEIPTCMILAKIERTGVKIDSDLLFEQSNYLGDQIQKIEQKCYKISDKVFNLSSPKQIREILFNDMALPVIKKTKGGEASTAEEVLQELSETYELPSAILEYRHYTKLKTTYTDKLPTMVNKLTQRVHTSYQQAVAITGRLSSTEPNLQNIPVKTEIGRQIRQAFIPEDGYKIMAADYSQVELRIMAYLSNDKAMINAFKNNLDIHTATAAEIMSIKLEDVTTDQRRKAKSINFGLIYGMSSFGLAKQLKISRLEAQSYIDLYFERYPGIKRYMDEIKMFAREKGYVKTVYGRRLYLDEINARNMQKQKAAERAAINSPIQGTAADIIKIAMINVDNWIITTNAPVKMIMQVHDELVFEVKNDYIDEARLQINKLMSEACDLSLPLVVDIGVGNNWDEAH